MPRRARVPGGSACPHPHAVVGRERPHWATRLERHDRYPDARPQQVLRRVASPSPAVSALGAPASGQVRGQQAEERDQQ